MSASTPITETDRTVVPAHGLDERNSRNSSPRVLAAWFAVPILTMGAIEGWYKRSDYAADAICYLDISRAIPRGDWRSVFNALWSSGYPLLIALIRPIFTQTAQGEWLAIHVLNLFILFFTYLAFLYLLGSFGPDLAAVSTCSDLHSKQAFLLFVGVCIFMCTELCINGPSRVSPDPLIDGFFFAATGTTMRLIRRPRKRLATLLGLILGFGYLVKAIFLPISAILLVVMAVALWRTGRRSIAVPALSAATFALIALPYVAGLSWALGRFTIGEAGVLNYAFMVNMLPYYTNWQGSPPGYGVPIHPTRMLLRNPPLFGFGEPFHNTYAAYGNIAYWYEGHRNLWSLKYQVLAIMRNLHYLAQAVVPLPMTWILAGVVIALWLLLGDQGQLPKLKIAGWPLLLPPIFAIAIYTCVYVEGRYLASFLATLSLAPFVSICLTQRRLSRRLRVSVAAALALGTVATLVTANRIAFARALRRQSYTQNRDWKLAAFLERDGLKPGSKVAVIGGPNLHCTWAYLAGLRIVAELGGSPYDPHPISGREAWWRHHEELPDPSAELFWKSSPALQSKVLEQFRQSGAVAVIAPAKPQEAEVAGWEHVPDSPMWVHHLER